MRHSVSSFVSFLLNLLHSTPNPPKITPRPLGRAQANNMNLCKTEALPVFQIATMVYQTCIGGLFRANMQIEQPLVQINLDTLRKVKIEITIDD